jgi:NOL1/NOP2/fmu family ribosome biogenesis protein
LLSFASQNEQGEILAYFSTRFGIPGASFDGLRFIKTGNTVWAVSDVPGLAEIVNGLKLETAGIPLLRMKKTLWKPTTAGLQCFGHQATRNMVDLNDETLEAFLKEGFLSDDFCLEPGFVVIKWNGRVLGCGLYSKGRLTSQVPTESWRQIRGMGDDQEV